MGRLFAKSGGGSGTDPSPQEICASGSCPPCSPAGGQGGAVAGVEGNGALVGGAGHRGPHGGGGSGNACCGATTSLRPVRYFTGEVQLSVDDLVIEGFGRRWGHTRVYSNQLNFDADLGNGFNWLVPQWAYIADPNDNQTVLAVVLSPSKAFWFDEGAPDVYAGRHGVLQSLAYNSGNGTYEFTDTDGTVWEFHDFFSSTPGKLKSVKNPGGQQLTLSYDVNDRVQEMQRVFGTGVSQRTQSILYSYTGGAIHIADAILRRKVGSTGSWENIRKVVYSYYSSSANGLDNDLEKATVQVPNGLGGWTDHSKYYYRYYKTGAAAHGLKHILGPDSYQRLAAIATPETASDAQLNGYADHYFEYDSNGRVSLEKTHGGTYTYTFTYTNSAHANGYSNWKRKTVETLPDGNQNIVYSNYVGQPLIKDFKSGADNWIEHFKYDSNGRLIEHDHPSAVVSYSDASANLNVSLNSTSGLIELITYYSSTTATSTTAGAAKGYEEYRKLKKGSSGSAVNLSLKKYFKQTVGSITVFPLAESTLYQDDAGGGSDLATTQFAYTWHTGTLQVKQLTTKMPAVPTAENGKNTVDERLDVFDTQGNLVWDKGPRGFIRYQEFDLERDAMTKVIEDVDTDLTTEFVGLPAGWSNSTGLHLVSNFEVDEFGRTTQVLGPKHNIDLSGTSTEVRRATWTIFDDVLREVRIGQGYQKTTGGAFTLINPVSITKFDRAGRVSEQIAATRASTSGKLLSSDTFAQSSYVRWSTMIYTDQQELSASRVYHVIPGSGSGSSGTNYNETVYGYDNLGRQCRLVTPGGTITRTVFDARGLVSSVWIGTDDVPTSGPWSPTNNSGANMTKITEYQYDGNVDGGDGNLTKDTQHVDASTTRVTNFTFDWRNRRQTTDGEVDFFEKLTYDNLDRVIKAERYNTTESAANLVARSETKYDSRNRVFQRIRYKVTAGTGAVGDKLTDNVWYDCCGNVIKEQPAGSKRFTKMVYDGVGRMTKQYVGLDSDESTYAEAETITGDSIFEQTDLTYDGAGNMIKSTAISRYHDETGTGTLVAGTDGRPSHTGFWHDALGRQVAMAAYGNQANDSTAFSRPATIPAASDTVLVTKTEYNDNGEAFKTIDPAGKDDRVEFDDAGRRTKTIENYADGNPATGSDDQDVTVEFTYNADGNLATLKAKNVHTGDQTTSYVYGTSGITPEVFRNDLLRAEIYPDSDDVASPLGNGADAVYDRVEYIYNRQAEVIERKDQNGTIHAYNYDKLGRQTQDRITTPGSGIDTAALRIETAYEVRGAVARVSTFSSATVGSGTNLNEVVREYNDLGMLAKEHQEHSGAKTGSTPYVQVNYDETAVSGELTKGMRPKSLRYPNGRLVHWTYGTGGSDADNLNRLNAINADSGGNPGAVLASYTYLGAGTVVKMDYEEPDVRLDLIGTGRTYSGFDRFMRLVDQKWYDYGASADRDRYKYGYNRASNRIWRENTTTTVKDEYYTYDGMHRLKNFDRGDLNGTYTAISGTPVREYDWNLDPTGNWETLLKKTSGITDLNQDRDHNKVNEVTVIDDMSGSSAGAGNWVDPIHDRSGNMTTMPQPAAPASSYTAKYDAWNRMVQVKSGITVIADYKYDGLNRRISTTIGGTVRHFYYSAAWQVLEERIGASTNAESQHVFGPRYVDELILRDRDTDSNGSLDERLYYLQDANFNVTTLVNTSGDAQERYIYEPYGEVDVFTGAWGARGPSSYANRFMFTGREYDAETGLYELRMRYQHAQLGRYLNRDPLKYFDGFSLYNAYFIPNSLDPSGMKKACCRFRKKSNSPTFVEEVDCTGGSAFSCCRKRAEGWWTVWQVVDEALGTCKQRPSGSNLVSGSLTVAATAGVIAVPTDPSDVIGTPVGGMVAGAALTVAGLAYICGSRSWEWEFPEESEDVRPIPADSRCEFYFVWCLWGKEHGKKGWKKTADCAGCFAECKATGGIWSFGKCPLGHRGPRWRGEDDSVWPPGHPREGK